MVEAAGILMQMYFQSLFASFLICVTSNSEYNNDPKFSYRHALANSADPDQTVTAPRGAV